MTMLLSIQEAIIHAANKYVGEQELRGNSGFEDKTFQTSMAKVGWEKGFPWCCFFAELIWKEAYASQPATVRELDKLFSGSALETYHRFSAAGTDKWLVSRTPKPGSVAIWRMGNGWSGHAGICTGVSPDGTRFYTVEGNTSSDGAREGDRVWTKDRPTYPAFKARGLNPVGFIYPRP